MKSLPDVVFITDNSHVDINDRTPLLCAKWYHDDLQFGECLKDASKERLQARVPQWYADISKHKAIYTSTERVPFRWLRNIVRNFRTRNLFQ